MNDTRDIDNGEGDDDTEDAKLADIVFILQELLRLTSRLDFGDEVGRRKLYAICRKFIIWPVATFKRDIDILNRGNDRPPCAA